MFLQLTHSSLIMMDALFSYRPPSSSSSSGERKNKNEVDYSKNPTKLFKRVEGRDWESSVERIISNPVEAKIWVYKNSSFDGSIKWKRLPLHEACIRKPTPKLMEYLLRANSAAAMTADSDGRLPLHHICANGASLDVVELLLVACPEAMERQDRWKKTPLQTLMSQYFPDPHCISALKRGVDHYKTQGRVNAAPVPAPRLVPSTSSLGSTAPPPMRFQSSYPYSSRSYDPPLNQDSRMVDGLQGEIGRYSETIAVNMDKEKTMYKRIRMLEGEVNRLLSKDNENIRLHTELRNLENELRSTNDEFDNERAQGTRTLQILEDVQRSEDRLKQQLEDTINDPRQRLLEGKMNEMALDLHAKDSRYEKDVQSLKHALQNAERDANHVGNECNKMQLEMQKLQYEKKSCDDNIQDLNRKLSNMDTMRRDMDDMDKDQRIKQDALRDMTRTIQQLKEENARLCVDQNDMVRIKDEFQSQANYVYDMEEKLGHSEDEIGRLKEEIDRFKNEVATLTHTRREEIDFSQRLQDELHAMERENEKIKLNEDNVLQLKEDKETFRTERNDLQQTTDNLAGELREAKTINADLTKEIDNVRIQYDENRHGLAETKKEMNEHKKKEVLISLEVHKLQVSMKDKIGEFKHKLLEERAKYLHLSTTCEGLELELKRMQEQTLKTEPSRASSEFDEKIKDQDKVIKVLTRKGKNLELEVEQKDQDAQRQLEHWNKEKASLVKLEESALTQQKVLQDRIASLETMLTNQMIISETPIDPLRTKKHWPEEKSMIKSVEMESLKKIEIEKRLLERKNVHVQDQLIIMREKRDATNEDPIECKRTLDQRQIEDTSSQTLKENDFVVVQLRKEGAVIRTRLYEMEKENYLLREMLEEPDDKSSDSLNDIEERLFDLEQRKDAEIAVLAEERDDLILETSRLNDRNVFLETEVKRLQSEYTGRSAAIERLRQKRDRKKQTIQERLKEYEARSSVGSILSIEKINARMEKDEAASFISGISYELPTSIGDDRDELPDKQRVVEQKRRSIQGEATIYERRQESHLPSMLYIDERDDDLQSST